MPFPKVEKRKKGEIVSSHFFLCFPPLGDGRSVYSIES